jgi:hypothetical protein
MKNQSVYRYWTKQEEKTIISCIKNNPENLSKAFACAAEVINRSTQSVSNRYYTHIRNKKAIFQTSSSKSVFVNSKNVSRRKNQSNASRVDVFASMFKMLTTDEKARVLMSLL